MQKSFKETIFFTSGLAMSSLEHRRDTGRVWKRCQVLDLPLNGQIRPKLAEYIPETSTYPPPNMRTCANSAPRLSDIFDSRWSSRSERHRAAWHPWLWPWPQGVWRHRGSHCSSPSHGSCLVSPGFGGRFRHVDGKTSSRGILMNQGSTLLTFID